MNAPPEIDLPGLRLYHSGITAEPGAGGHSTFIIHRPLNPGAEPDDWAPSDFSGFFKSIVTELNNYSWIFDDNTFTLPWNDDGTIGARMDAVLSTAHRGQDGVVLVTSPGFLNEMARYIRDDWNGLCGVAAIPTEPERLLKLHYRHGYERAFLNEIDLLFENYDGLYWAVFTRHVTLLDRVKADLANDHRISIVETSLLDTWAIHERELQEWLNRDRASIGAKALAKRQRRLQRKSKRREG